MALFPTALSQIAQPRTARRVGKSEHCIRFCLLMPMERVPSSDLDFPSPRMPWETIGTNAPARIGAPVPLLDDECRTRYWPKSSVVY
jgi:hypothetical protein